MSERIFTMQAPYGAFELKRCYQKNMLLGTLISGGLPLLILAAFVVASFIGNLGTMAVEIPIPDKGVDWGPPPPPTVIDIIREPTNIKVEVELPKFGRLNPVEDDEVFVVHTLATINQKIDLIQQDLNNKYGGTDVGNYDANQIYIDMAPPPGTFVPRTEEPVLLQAPDPVYPDMARRAGIEGDVIVQIFVDKSGNVADALIARDSKCNAGFEEAAIAAALKRKYRPAMQNENPVGVWISYKVQFKLK